MTDTLVVSRGWSYAATIPYDTPDSLDDLHGPLTGVVTVPPSIDTSPDPTYRLDDPSSRESLYTCVVRDGISSEQEDWLDKDTLIALWGQIFLPKECRAVWETKFPELRAAATSINR